jgi:dCMP deaminase
MDTAFIWADRSTCDRLHVGCVIHRDGRILVQGYNGAPAGLTHCNHNCDCPAEIFRSRIDDAVKLNFDAVKHREICNSLKPCTRAVHAEQNAISFAARWGVGLEGAEASVTHQPCVSCAQSLINAGIVRVTYTNSYRLKDGVSLLREAGIEVLTIPPPSDRIHG